MLLIQSWQNIYALFYVVAWLIITAPVETSLRCRQDGRVRGFTRAP